MRYKCWYTAIYTYCSIVSVELLCVSLEHLYFTEQVLLEAGLDLNQVILNLSLENYTISVITRALCMKQAYSNSIFDSGNKLMDMSIAK